MKRKVKRLEAGFSRILWAILVVVLFAAPCICAEIIDYEIPGPDAYWIWGTTVDILTGANIIGGLYITPGSIVNIYGGNVGGEGITLLQNGTDPVVTVYGTGFAVDGMDLNPSATEFTPDPYNGSVLTVTYTDGSGNPNGGPVNLFFQSDIPINLVNTAAVSDPAQMIQDLIDTVTGMNLQQGIDNSLDAKLDAALGALDDVNQNNDAAAINTLQAFINAVEAQRDNKITSEQADILIAAAQAIIDLLST